MGKRLKLVNGGQSVPGYLAKPLSAAAHGVIVVQEWWGLVPHIERVADRFADEGFVALAPDLYRGQTADAPTDANKLMMGLRVEDAARDIESAITHLMHWPSLGSRKVGIVGFCMGGALSLFCACRLDKIGACVVFYGSHPNIRPDIVSLQAPVLGIYAGRDQYVTPDSVATLDHALTVAGKRHEFHIYPDARHAFFNEDNAAAYDATAAGDAWSKTLSFLRSEL